jgi:hypothetical protein
MRAVVNAAAAAAALEEARVWFSRAARRQRAGAQAMERHISEATLVPSRQRIFVDAKLLIPAHLHHVRQPRLQPAQRRLPFLRELEVRISSGAVSLLSMPVIKAASR